MHDGGAIVGVGYAGGVGVGFGSDVRSESKCRIICMHVHMRMSI